MRLGLTLSLLLLIVNAYGVGFGIAPSIIDLKDLTRGQSAENVVTIYNSQNEEQVFYPSAEKYSNWITVLDTVGNVINEITVPPNSSKSFIIRVTVPNDAANGEYEIPLYFETKAPGKGTGIRTKSPLKIKLEVVGQQRVSVKVLSYDVQDTEKGVPAKFSVSILNDGNVIATPTFKVVVIDDNKSIFEKEETAEISPREIKTLKITWDTSEADEKAYKAKLQVFTENKMAFEKLTEFNVFEKGTLTASLHIINASISKPVLGKQAKIDITVKNTGYIDYETKLKVEIYKGEEFIGVTQSDPLWLEIGKTGRLTAYYLFEEEGEYTLKPSIIYAGKMATVSPIMISVEKKEAVNKSPGFSLYLAAIVITGVAIAMRLTRR